MKWFLLLWRRFWRLRSVTRRTPPIGNVTLQLNAGGTESITCSPGDDWKLLVGPDGTVVVTNREPINFAINEDSDVTHITIRMPPADDSVDNTA